MFFSDKFHIKYSEQNKIVRISIRSSEERIDEYFIDLKNVIQFCSDFNFSSQWFGNIKLQGKILNQIAYLRINIHDNARYTYKMGVSDLQLLHARLNTLSSSFIEDLEVNESISEEESITITSDSTNINQNLLQDILNQINYLNKRINELEKIKPIERIIEKQIVKEQSDFQDDFEEDIPIFIPSRIKTSNLKGNINTQDKDNNFNIDKSLEKLNKGEE